LATAVEQLESAVERLSERVASLEALVERLRHRPATGDDRLGMTVEEARARLAAPKEYSPEVIEKFRALMGSWEGPEDLSENMREYRWRDKFGEQ
jgi:hypothetical protein